MATDNHSIRLAASPDAPIAEEEHPQASWAETAITVIAMVITVLIVMPPQNSSIFQFAVCELSCKIRPPPW